MRILVAVIAYNEEKNIKHVIKDLQDNNFGFDIVVIDNGSFDSTVQASKEMGIDTIIHCINSGSSAGTLMSYFMYAYRNQYDILCQFDSDGQHLASELPKIVDPVLNQEADYVIGSRFITNEGFQSHFFRRIGIKLFAKIDSLIIGQNITDVTSGFRAYGKKTIGFFAKYYKHEVYDPSQLLLLSHYSGTKIIEVPVKMRERLHGKSEFNILSSLSFPIKGIINVTGCILQRNQIRNFTWNYNGN